MPRSFTKPRLESLPGGLSPLLRPGLCGVSACPRPSVCFPKQESDEGYGFMQLNRRRVFLVFRVLRACLVIG